MIKVINKRTSGSLFHYAHFICDCLFQEVISEIYTYETVVREKNLNQTIGNFSRIYEEVMGIKNLELPKNEFDALNVDMVIPKTKESYDITAFNKFRNFIFNRYKVDASVYDPQYPDVLLIQRGDRINLIDDPILKTINSNITTGRERREINNIDDLKIILEKKTKSKNYSFKTVMLENLTFEEQVKHFNNAKIIICAHGAGMSNMFFCKGSQEFKKTTIIEVTCNTEYKFFDTISSKLGLNHVKCKKNNVDEIMKLVDPYL